MPMLTFSEIEHKLADAGEAIKTHAATIFHHGEILLSQDIQAEWATIKAAALVEVKDKSPEIQAAVEVVLEDAEKAFLAFLESRLA